MEEPESHLHSGAIHSLVEVIKNISQNSQVIITTHNPLFVQQNNIKSNIIVNSGTAQPAKSIAEIRNILGVLPSDNLKNASHVFIVEGEDDKIALTKILSVMSNKISTALSTNKLVIKSLGGAGNLSHDIADLKNCMCKYFVLLDNDEAGNEAIEKAISKGLLTEADYKLTICNGSPVSEFEDCLKKEIYEQELVEKFQTNINTTLFRSNKKWSDRVKDVRMSQGGRWTDSIEKQIKLAVADAIPETISNIEDIVIMQKAGFLNGCVEALERMLEIS
ncbi:MAG: ATP-dependent nuclease [Ruminiclostridium sp.]